MSFAFNAVVKDVGREIRGIAAIKEWANQEIFAVNAGWTLGSGRVTGRPL
jgi:hypothetical protein